MSGVLLTHLALLGVTLWSVNASGPGLRAFAFGYLISYVYRLATLKFVLFAGPELGGKVTRPPHPDLESQPVYVENEDGTKTPGGFGHYLGFVCALSAVAAGILIAGGGNIEADARNGLATGALWWLVDLANRRLVVDFDQPIEVNAGYNGTGLDVLMMSLLTGGLLSYLSNAPGPMLYALLFWKTVYEARYEARYPRSASATAEH